MIATANARLDNFNLLVQFLSTKFEPRQKKQLAIAMMLYTLQKTAFDEVEKENKLRCKLRKAQSVN